MYLLKFIFLYVCRQLKELSLELTEMKLVEAGRSHHAESTLKSPESIGDDATLLKVWASLDKMGTW